MKFQMILTVLFMMMSVSVMANGHMHSGMTAVITGPSSAGATYTTGSGTPLFDSVTFKDGTPVKFVPTTPTPRAPASAPVADAPVPYNNMDYWERPKDKDSYYNSYPTN